MLNLQSDDEKTETMERVAIIELCRHLESVCMSNPAEKLICVATKV